MAIGSLQALPSFGMVTQPNGLSALFAIIEPDFSAIFTTLFHPFIIPQLFSYGSMRALIKAAVRCRGPRWAGASEQGEFGPASPKAHRVLSSRTAATGAPCVFMKGQGAAGRWPPLDLDTKTTRKSKGEKCYVEIYSESLRSVW